MKRPSSGIDIIKDDGSATYRDNFFDCSEADCFLAGLISEVPWTQDSIKMFGRSVLQPRLTCWMGDFGAA